MDPITIGLILGGLSLIGSLWGAAKASGQEAAMEEALKKQLGVGQEWIDMAKRLWEQQGGISEQMGELAKELRSRLGELSSPEKINQVVETLAGGKLAPISLPEIQAPQMRDAMATLAPLFSSQAARAQQAAQAVGAAQGLGGTGLGVAAQQLALGELAGQVAQPALQYEAQRARTALDAEIARAQAAAEAARINTQRELGYKQLAAQLTSQGASDLLRGYATVAEILKTQGGMNLDSFAALAQSFAAMMQALGQQAGARGQMASSWGQGFDLSWLAFLLAPRRS